MNFLKFLLLGVVSIFSLFSCVRETDVFDVEAQWEMDKIAIREYVKKNYPNAVEQESTGIWYLLEEAGEQASYRYRFNEQLNELVFPRIRVHYKLRLLTSDRIVQETAADKPAELNLIELVESWQRAFFPKAIGDRQTGGLLEGGLQKGGKILIFTPSHYAYGTRAERDIPANSPLFFEIEVLDIKE